MAIFNTFGFHSIFFYYGKAHLIVNLDQYIKTGIERNEYIYLCIGNELFKSIIEYFGEEERKQIEVFSLENTVNRIERSGKQNITNILSGFQKNALENGYSGARVVWDAGFLINKLSRSTFINIEKITSDIIAELKVSLMCIYDFDNYVNLKTIINKKLIEETYKTYNYRLFKMKLIKI
jgi:hypothetical protein